MRLQDISHTVDLTVEESVIELVEAKAELKRQQEVVFYLEKAVVEGMLDRGATVVKTEIGEATLTTPVTYDYGILAGLREITGPDDLVGYTPEREVVKREPERWNLTQAKTLGKLSHAHADILSDARIYGNPKVKFQAKKGGR